LSGEDASDCDTDALRAEVVREMEVVRDIDTDVLGVPVGLVSRVSLVVVGRRTGELCCGVECRLRAANDFRGEALRRGRELLESKLPCDIPCRHVMMRSLGGWVDMLSLLERWLVRDKMLLGRPMPDALFIDAVSSCSLMRMRFAKAQSCRNTFSAPV
jgi:hypothetical protein